MTWRNIKLILLREVRDQLRDRRTLFMVLVLPVLLYPGLGIGMLQMAMYFTEQPKVVVMLGADELPSVSLLEDGHIAPQWFRISDHTSRLTVVSDARDDRSQSATPLPGSLDRQQLLTAARHVGELARQRNELGLKLAPFDAKIGEACPWGVPKVAPPIEQKPANFEQLVSEFHELESKLSAAFITSKLQLVIVFPTGFGKLHEEVDRLLEQKDFNSAQWNEMPFLHPLIVMNRASEKSDVAYRKLREALERWEQELLNRRLQAANLPPTLPDPVNAISVDIAGQEQVAASVWSKLFPALLVIMALTGAFYPAIDVAAGEKERGTMETLLICPATRSEIVLGKFLTVLLFSMATTLLNLISMGFTSRYIVSVTQAATAVAGLANLPLPTPMAIVWLLVLLVPLAALFSALCLALATFARSSKEGQYYLSPLFMVTLGLTMFSMSPSIELSPTAGTSLFYCAMPLVGPALLLKALLVNPANREVLVFAVPVLMSSVAYSMLALWWAVEQFKSEDVLFREAERFDLRLWLRHLLRDKEPLPTTGQAAACFVLMMLLQFVSLNAAGRAITGTPPEQLGAKVMQIAVIQQIALIAGPAIFMALLLTSSARQTLRITLPPWKYFGVALALPLMLHPLAIEILSSLKTFFPQLPDGAKAAFAAMQDTSLPFVFVLGTFALTPAICEELAFRGFILSGLGRNGRTGVAILISSVTFGIIHMIPQQVFNATLIGMLIGLIAVRSGSLLPGVLFHFCFNGLAVLHGQAAEHLSNAGATDGGFFYSIEEQTLHYGYATLALCGTMSAALIYWLIRDGRPKAKSPVTPAFKNMSAVSV